MPQYLQETAPREGPKSVVLICSALKKLGNGLDLEEIRRWLLVMEPSVDVRMLSGFCGRPGKMLEALATDGPARVVMGLCSQDYSEIELHASARKVGLDPYGVEVVNLGAHCALVHPRPEAVEKAKLLLNAAVARARAFSGSSSESVKPVLSWNRAMSRRALFTLPPLHYEPVISIRKEDCAFEEGCRVCSMTCPREALAPSVEGLMVLDKSRCTGCGACVSTCPQTAIDLPGALPGQIEAHIASLSNTSSPTIDPRGILFVCGKSGRALEGLARGGFSYAAGWLPVEVPCLGMVTPAWFLHCLNLGFVAVAGVPCLEDDCRFGKTEVTRGRVDYCREFLSLVGASPEAVRLLDPRDEQQLAKSLGSLPEREEPGKEISRDIGIFTSQATARALLGLAERFAPSSVRSLAHPYSPLGIVKVEQGCTMCESCTQNCPTNALSIERDAERIALTFDAELCIGCEACAPVCPERVIHVEKVTDLSRLNQGKLTLYRGSEMLCEKCGSPVAPDEMLKKITSLLGSDDPAVSAITRFCLSCRGATFSGM